MFKLRGLPVGRLGALSVAALAVLALFSGSTPASVGGAGFATLSVAPSSAFAAPSSVFTVEVRQNASVTTTGAQVNLAFDPSVLTLTDVDKGSAYTAGSLTVGVSTAGGAAAYPTGFGAAESGASCSNGTDDDGDGLINDGCSATGAAESGGQCSDSSDSDGDGRVNDGCPLAGSTAEANQCSGTADNDSDGTANDGCPATGGGESLYQCLNTIDDDQDTSEGVSLDRVNDGCPIVGTGKETGCGDSLDNDSDGVVNDGCPADGPPETGSDCLNATDEDADTKVNDGCPFVNFAAGGEFETDCANATDGDGDGLVNDGCPPNGSSPETGLDCSNTTDDDADNLVNDGCPVSGAPETGASCLNATDDDADTLANDGCSGSAAAETGAQCTNAIDDDGDALVNDGCQQNGGSEVQTACQGTADEDGDSVVNDGCPTAGGVPAVPESGPQCANSIDDDSDDFVNDGCPASGASETTSVCNADPPADDDSDGAVNDGCGTFNDGENLIPSACDPGNTIDEDVDGSVNDGCAAVGPAEVNQCTNSSNDDGGDDALVNDGCSAFGTSEFGGQCGTNAADDDADAAVNDGCPRGGTAESGASCGNALDDDGDRFVDDGCAESGGQCSDGIDSDADLVIDDGCFPPDESGPACDNILDDDADGLVNDGCPPSEAAEVIKANTVDGVVRQASVYLSPDDGTVTAGAKQSIKFTFTATSTDCVGSALTISSASMLDSVGDALANVITVNSSVGVASTADCDTDTVANTTDNCPFVSNAGQENNDVNFLDQTPPTTQDDRTIANSDAMGDACDTDDDNDGLTDAEELSGSACGGAITDPLDRDSDSDNNDDRINDDDRILDGAECLMGTNPNDFTSKPTAAACAAFLGVAAAADTDGDRIKDEAEFCKYNTNPNAIDTDGDQDGFPANVNPLLNLTKDGCEAASLNPDRVISSGDQLLMVQEIIREVSPSLRLISYDINKDGAVNVGDQLILAQFISPSGQCP